MQSSERKSDPYRLPIYQTVSFWSQDRIELLQLRQAQVEYMLILISQSIYYQDRYLVRGSPPPCLSISDHRKYDCMSLSQSSFLHKYLIALYVYPL